ncbi:MAG: helix-turn-helix transcriptional regulator [Proteobacteria bacterium]|nr:helix-turn-helix transcriptional regulator [Pseudomonadota bacterium]
MKTELSKTLKKLRNIRYLTAKDMAMAFGISESYMSLIENGKRPAPENFIENVQKFLNLSTNETFELQQSLENTQKEFFSDREDVLQRLIKAKKYVAELIHQWFTQKISSYAQNKPSNDNGLLDTIIEYLTNLKKEYENCMI